MSNDFKIGDNVWFYLTKDELLEGIIEDIFLEGQVYNVRSQSKFDHKYYYHILQKEEIRKIPKTESEYIKNHLNSTCDDSGIIEKRLEKLEKKISELEYKLNNFPLCVHRG